MKKIFVLLIFSFYCFYCVAVENKEFSLNNNVILVQQLQNSNNCQLLYYETQDGKGFYEVVASITTSLLPTMTYGICLLVVKNPAVCRVVSIATEALIIMNEDEIKDGIVDGLKWIGTKGSDKSSIKVQCTDNKDALAVYATFNEYKNRKCVKWEDITTNNSNLNDIYIINFEDRAIKFELSPDTKIWKSYELESGAYDAYVLWENNFEIMSKGYIRIPTNGVYTKHTIYINKRYSIRWNLSEKKWDLYEYK